RAMPGWLAVDQCYPAALTGQLQGAGDADNTGADYGDVGFSGFDHAQPSRLPSSRRRSCSGLPFFSAWGSRASGKSWKHTGRRKRRIAGLPTEVVRASEVAGNGPPCTIASHTSTPVGQPLTRMRPALRSRVGS